MNRIRRIGAVAFAIAAALTPAAALTALGHSGLIVNERTCREGFQTVYLNPGVTADRTINVTNTFGPDVIGLDGFHIDTTGATEPVQVWSVSGPQPFAGSTTLTILRPNGTVEFTTTKTIEAKTCETQPPSSPPSQAPTPTPTATPTASPTATPAPSAGTPTPSTPPSTATPSRPPTPTSPPTDSETSTGPSPADVRALLAIGIFGIVAGLYVAKSPGRRRR